MIVDLDKLSENINDYSFFVKKYPIIVEIVEIMLANKTLRDTFFKEISYRGYEIIESKEPKEVYDPDGKIDHNTKLVGEAITNMIASITRGVILERERKNSR